MSREATRGERAGLTGMTVLEWASGQPARARWPSLGLTLSILVAGFALAGCGGRTTSPGDGGVDADSAADAEEAELPESHQDTWVQWWSGNEPTTPGRTSAVAAARNGDVLVGGAYRGWLWLVRLDAEGRLVWERLLGAEPDRQNEAFAVVETEDEEIIVFGRAAEQESAATRGWLGLVDRDGELLWQRLLRIRYNDYQSSTMVVDSDLIVVQGRQANTDVQHLLAFGLDGELLWQVADHAEGEVGFGALFVTAEGEIIAIRQERRESRQTYNRIWRIDRSGRAVEAFELSSPCEGLPLVGAGGNAKLRGGLEHPEGGFVLYGTMDGSAAYTVVLQPWVARYDEEWNLVWSGILEDREANEDLATMIFSPEGDLVGVGRTSVFRYEGALVGAAWLVRITEDWTVAVSEGGYGDDGRSLALQGDRILMAGGNADRDLRAPFVARLTSEGLVDGDCVAHGPYPMTFVECRAAPPVVQLDFTGVPGEVEVEEGSFRAHEVPSSYEFLCPET